jgi:hypothetical protein
MRSVAVRVNERVVSATPPALSMCSNDYHMCYVATLLHLIVDNFVENHVDNSIS